MNIIFLDVDGVLNSVNHARYCKEVLNYEDISGSNYPFDDEALMNLKYLVDITDAKIIISSYWKLFENNIIGLMNKLKEYDLDNKVIGFTPNIDGNKVKEIMYLINENGYDNYIVLDDSSLDIPYLVKTNRFNGLDTKNVSDGIKILSKNRE